MLFIYAANAVSPLSICSTHNVKLLWPAPLSACLSLIFPIMLLSEQFIKQKLYLMRDSIVGPDGYVLREEKHSNDPIADDTTIQFNL